MQTPIDIARAAYGKDLPDWVEALALACGRSSQAAVARQLDRSGAVVSQILRAIYPAKTTQIEERVRGVLMNGTVECPALGLLPIQICQDHRQRARESVITNSHRARMQRACSNCSRNQKEGQE
ncbi:hypothetical protein HS053_13445 [Tabrizicola sp. SY72]|nr:hypothetical protein [Tabrizicola sp. SY72]